MRRLVPVALVGLLLLGGCGEEDMARAPVTPAAITADAVGHYCGMNLTDHPGPKGQVHLAGQDRPVWMSSVRDTLAFLMLPEEPKTVTAVFVSDMGRATAPDAADPAAWVEARDAWYVVGARLTPTMGMAELFPFALEREAKAFAAHHGGEVRRFTAVTEADVLDAAPEEPAAAPTAHDGHGRAGTAGAHHGH